VPQAIGLSAASSITLTVPTITLNGAVTGTGVTSTRPGGGTSTNFVATAGAGVGYAWQDTSQTTDAKVWDALATGSTLTCRAVNDANSAANNWLTVTRTGYVPQVMTLAVPTIALNVAGGPTITSGAAAPASTQPQGSLYLRQSATAGNRLYVSAGGGTWTAVAGV
jgi:hypothetical protein